MLDTAAIGPTPSLHFYLIQSYDPIRLDWDRSPSLFPKVALTITIGHLRADYTTRHLIHLSYNIPRSERLYIIHLYTRGRATAFITASQILLSREVAGLDDSDQAGSSPLTPLIAILENSSVHILSVGPAAAPEVTRVSVSRSSNTQSYHITPPVRPTTTGPLSDRGALPHFSSCGDRDYITSTEQLRTMSGKPVSPDDTSTPLRSRASSPPTQPDSARSSFSFGTFSQRSHSEHTSSEESPTRGRSLVRMPARNRPHRQFSIHRQERPRTINWDSALAQQRLMSRDLTAEPQDIFGCLQEPLPPGTERFRTSLSEELYKTATWGTPVDLSRFGDHRDTFAILGLRHLQSRRIGLPDIFFERLLFYVDFKTYLAIRLSCRCWSEAITKVCPIPTPPISILPTETIENILVYLAPLDFNSARHVCRTWMVASLDRALLTHMLKQGGWLGAVEADIARQRELDVHDTCDTPSKEWTMGKRLATECSLMPGWSGNGLHYDRSPPYPKESAPSLERTSATDFTELNIQSAMEHDDESGQTLQYTVSICNKFVLVYTGCVIHIYSIHNDGSMKHQYGGYMAPLTTVIAPRPVQAVSMDTSSGRFAIAALMEDRVGLVCDVSEFGKNPKTFSNPRALPASIRDSRGPMYSARSSSDQIMADAPRLPGRSVNRHQKGVFSGSTIAETSSSELHGARNSRQSGMFEDSHLPSAFNVSPGSSQDYDLPTTHLPMSHNMPVAAGPRSIYRNLCSSDDPPRSVAICPQRRCVAFGCAAGIELHWIDALTGQDLNRWFPLTAPSDHLYFLPPRPGVDSAKKLRLISSAGNPEVRKEEELKFFPLMRGRPETRFKRMTWGQSSEDAEPWDDAWRGNGWADHFKAVPISDGWNVLFTEPQTSILCLGSDSPPGNRGSRLVKRFQLIGPKDANGKPVPPSVYAAGRDLRWGVRIVACYGEALWLFVVPPDTFLARQIDDSAHPHEANGHPCNKPVGLEGIKFGRVDGLVDLAVDTSHGDLTIWAFTSAGLAYVWQLAGRQREEIHRTVLGNGSISSSLDADGDEYMHGSTPPTAYDFDGAAAPLLLHQNREADRIIDKGSDTVMYDAPSPLHEDEGYVSEYEQAGGEFAIHAPPLHGRWSEDDDADWVPDYLQLRGTGIEDEGLGVDLLEMSRIDVEVLRG